MRKPAAVPARAGVAAPSRYCINFHPHRCRWRTSALPAQPAQTGAQVEGKVSVGLPVFVTCRTP